MSSGCSGCAMGCGDTAGCRCGGSCGGACANPGQGAACCRGSEASTPQPIWNRPGLRELDYRVGTHPQFLASMLAGLSRADRPGLRGLRTRASDDLSIALLDGWATLGDLLSFYTERIAQEGYLRTATERRSLTELAALVGYRPRPGLAASAYFAYTVAPDTVVQIPPGTRAQSVPKPGDLPATFETAEPLEARTAANLLPVRRTRPQQLTADTFGGREALMVAGPQPQLRPGHLVQVGFPQSSAWALAEVTSVEVLGDRTRLGVRVTHDEGVGSGALAALAPVEETGDGVRIEKNTTRLGELVEALRKPPSVPPRSARELQRPLSTLLAGGSDAVVGLLSIAVPGVADTLGSALGGIQAPDSDPAEVTHWTVQARLFGHQAPLLAEYVDGKVQGFTDPLVSPLPVTKGAPVIGIAAEAPDQIEPPNFNPQDFVLMDAVYDSVSEGMQVAFVNEDLAEPVEFRTVKSVTETSVSLLGVTARVTRLQLDEDWPRLAGDATKENLSIVLRGTTVLTAPATLTPADEPFDDEDVAGDLIELDGLHRDLEPGRWIVVAGERTDAAIAGLQRQPAAVDGPGSGDGTGVSAAELSMIASVQHRTLLLTPRDEEEEEPGPLPGDPVHTFVRLAEPLAYRYRRPTVTVYGNVVRATHGETTEEVLGSGDATRPWASYRIKKPPLTHLPAATAEGARSTLEVFVDGLRWREVPDFAVAGPSDRCYTVTYDEDGSARVVFGDGERGLRPPTGTENIVARYRSGQGLVGNVDRGTITIATSRPLGVMEVTNPVPGTGGADPDDDESLRLRTPIGVRALDRLVSVSDHADFATAFAGVGSAAADEITDGRRRVVHVTIAGVDDAPIGESSDLVRSLRRALLDLGDPHTEVRVGVRHLRLAVVSARVRVAADRRWEDVEPAVRRSVLSRFGPASQRVGVPLASSAVLAAMAAVPGVDYVDLDVFDSLDEEALVQANPADGLGLRSVLAAGRARTDRDRSGGIRPAELVLVSPAAPDTFVLSLLTDADLELT